MPRLAHPIIQDFNQINGLLMAGHEELRRPQFGNVHQFYNRLHANGVLVAWKKFNKIQHLESSNEIKLRHWIRNKVPAPQLNFRTVENRAALIRKVMNIKLADLIVLIASVASVALAMIWLIFLFPYSLIPWIAFVAKPICLISFLSSKLLFLSHLIISVFFAKVMREKRVNESENFQSFVQKYLVERVGFIPNQEDLLDSKLHDLYSKWKKKSINILRN